MKFNNRSSVFTQILLLCFAVSVHLLFYFVFVLKRVVEGIKVKTRPERIRRP